MHVTAPAYALRQSSGLWASYRAARRELMPPVAGAGIGERPAYPMVASRRELSGVFGYRVDGRGGHLPVALCHVRPAYVPLEVVPEYLARQSEHIACDTVVPGSDRKSVV